MKLNNNHKYDLIFLSNLPAFYKVRQWNEIGRQKKVLVLLTDENAENRNADFVSEKFACDYEFLKGNVIKKAKRIAQILRCSDYNRLVIGGWDNAIFLIAALLSDKAKNTVVCESSIYEYRASLQKDLIKRWFLRRISIGYPAGKPQGRLLRTLGFKGELRYSGGCGLLNYIIQPTYKERKEVSKFLYVGRLAPEKNIELLISVFNDLPNLTLTIVGFGPLESRLKALAGGNIHFAGTIPNKQLPSYYQNADCFVLPSLREPWGLVIEEALNNGCPVIVSDVVGCNEDLVSPRNGLVFQHDSAFSLKDAIKRMCNTRFYNLLRLEISKLDFFKHAEHQVDIFLK